MVLLNKKRYIGVFTINESSIPSIIAIKRLKAVNQSIRFMKHTFPFDITTPSYTKGLKNYYFFSLTLKKQLTFDDTYQPNINTEVIDAILSQKIVQQLTANLNDSFKPNLMMFIIGVLIGIFGGYFYAQYTLTHPSETVKTATMITNLFSIIRMMWW